EENERVVFAGPHLLALQVAERCQDAKQAGDQHEAAEKDPVTVNDEHVLERNSAIGVRPEIGCKRNNDSYQSQNTEREPFALGRDSLQHHDHDSEDAENDLRQEAQIFGRVRLKVTEHMRPFEWAKSV